MSASARLLGAGAHLRRGMAAGLAAGVAAGLFELAVGEPSVEQAIRLEQLAAGGHAAEEVFSRGIQRAGMVAATGLYGLAIGGVLGLVLFLLSRRMAGSGWQRSMRVALGGFGAFWLVPFLKYPANPPAVGDPATVGVRTAAYLAMAAVSVAACFVAVLAARRMAAQASPPHRRQLLVAAGYLLVVTTAFVALPPAADVGDIPAALLWDFRLAAAGGQTVLWVLTGVGLGVLTLRAERRAAGGASRAPVEGGPGGGPEVT